MNHNINILFGRIIAGKRKQLGISQEELAYRCGVHRTYIGAIERGEKSPTLTTIDEGLCRTRCPYMQDMGSLDNRLRRKWQDYGGMKAADAEHFFYDIFDTLFKPTL